MLYLDNYSKAQKFHNNLIRCWLSIKINGRKGPTYKNGYNCGDKKCPLCSIKTNIDNSIPKGFKDFLNTKNNLEILIDGQPNALRLLHNRYENLTFTKSEKDSITKFFIETSYTNWFQPTYAFNFLGLLNKNTCIYCNRNYTRTIKNVRDEKVMISELDHWFPKKKFPILAISFHNLIPSCHSCNSSIKGDANIRWDRALRNMTHPYLKEAKQNFKFSYVNKSLNEFNVKINVTNNSKIDKTLKFFKINEVYNSHSDLELRDLLDLRHKYSENYIDMLVNKTFNGVLNPDEIYRYIFGIEIEEHLYHKRPLSKFKHDIIEELMKIKD